MKLKVKRSDAEFYTLAAGLYFVGYAIKQQADNLTKAFH